MVESNKFWDLGGFFLREKSWGNWLVRGIGGRLSGWMRLMGLENVVVVMNGVWDGLLGLWEGDQLVIRFWKRTDLCC